MPPLVRFLLVVGLTCVADVRSMAEQRVPRLFVDVAREFVQQPRRVRVVGGEIFVLSGQEGIVVFDRDFNRKRRFGSIGQGPDDLRLPQDFDVCGSGEVVIADLASNLVRTFNRAGAVQNSFESPRPNFIDCLSNGNIAVGERGASAFIRVYSRDGTSLHEIGKADPYPGATAQQSLAFQPGPFREIANGEFLMAQALSIPPTAVILRNDGSTGERFALPTAELEELLGLARERRSEMLAQGHIGGRGTVNYATMHPATGDVWVAPGAEGIFRFTRSGTLIDRLDVVDVEGNRYGFQDFDFLSPTEIVGRAGPWLVRARIDGIKEGQASVSPRLRARLRHEVN